MALVSLSAEQEQIVESARRAAFRAYEGAEVPHRSCGIALAETFGVATPAYQALRRGGITGEGFCGAIQAGELILGELLGDPAPDGAVTEALRSAIIWYRSEFRQRIDRRAAADYVCNSLTGQFADFGGAPRRSFCTHLVADVAALVAEALLRFDPEARPLAVAAPESSP